MVGNSIYLIFCKHLSDGQGGHETLETPHATFDGTFEHMNRIKEHWRTEKGFRVTEGNGGSFRVDGPHGFQRLYYVVTRTIEK